MHKFVKSFLRATILFCLISIFAFSYASQSFASELIGTHLGEGDVGAQINIIRNILIPNGLEPNSPVTVMVPVTMLQPSQIGTVQQLADAVNSGGYFPLVRINGVCANFSAETGLNARQSVEAAQAVFGSNAIIIWGNEVNNQEVECSDWSKYLSDAQQLAGMSNVSPAALDYYMGNPSYTVSEMYSQTPGMEAVFNTSPRVGNAYGCVGSNSTDCDPLATTTQEVGYNQIGNPFYLTEFSLSPEGNSADAPDTDLEKVIEFIQNRAGETGAQKVTPLVRNVCNNESTWLIYVNGRLFTSVGTEVTDDCEGSFTGGTGYDLDIYPEYGVDETKSYITPIRNLLDSGSTQRTVEKLRKELAMSGYQAYTIAEGLKIEPEYNTRALIDKYLEQYPDGYQELRIDAIETLDFSNARYPLWRDVSNKQFLLTSLEEYFGFRDVYEPNPATSVLTSSPINSLLSEPQLCVQGWKNLVAQQLMCERLENPAECELLTRPIPDTNHTVATALDLLARYYPYYRDGTSIIGCSMLMAGTRPELGIPFSQAEMEELKKTLINTPTYFDRAYRYGFVVAVIHSKDPGTLSGNIATKIFNFFSIDTRDLVPKDEVLVAAFKLPDIGTNKGGGDDSGSQFWSDPLDLTRKVLTTREAQLEHEDVKRDEKRREILQAAEGAAIQNESSRIYCYDGSFPGGDGTTSCKNELTKAITDIINGGVEGEGDTEDVSFITDVAGLDNPEEPYGRIFNQDNGGQVLLNLFAGDMTHWNGSFFDPQRARSENLRGNPDEKLTSLFTISNQTWPPEVADTTVDFYILYPMGFELKAVEEAMSGAFFTKAQLAELQQQNTVGGFEMTGQAMGLSAGSAGWTYIDTVATANQECGTETIYDEEGNPIGEVPKVCEERVSITVKQDNTGVGILGGHLGFWMRKVQMQLSSRITPAWEYFESCSTTEEFLLGKCSGGNFGNGNSGNGSPEVPVDELEGIAQCNGGPRIGSGGEAEHVDVQGTGACTGEEPTRLFVPELHDVPNWKNPGDPVADCEFLYSYVACNPEYADTLIQNPVNSEGKFVENGNTTACEFVVQKAREMGVSPRLALAMWGEESGYSAYRVPDLGVVSQPAQDLGAQVTAFANTVNSYSNYIDFLEAYSGEERGEGDPSPNQFCNNPNFVARLKQFYDYLAPR